MQIAYEDKLQHFIVGISLSLSFHVFLYAYLDISYWNAVILNVIIVTIIAACWEFLSLWTGKGVSEYWDVIATMGGIPIGIILGSLVKYTL